MPLLPAVMLRTVRVPAEIEPLFAVAEAAVSQFFESLKHDPEHGTIEIQGERYILVRAASLSVEFFGLVEQLFGRGREAEARQFARNILFDLAHAVGKSDAREIHRRMNLSDPAAKLSAGPIHFSHSGWAFVDIAPESRPVPNEDCYFLFDHPYSFESDAWLRAQKPSKLPVCIMNAGYSSGWCEESLGVQLVSFEVACRARGDPTCRFIMAPPKHIEGYVRAYGAAGAAAGVTGEHYEISDFFSRKRAEEKLQRLYARLKEIDKLKTELFTNVSHELRTPLMLISGPVERLLGDERLDAEQRASLEVVQRNARILLRHVNDLLDVSKLEAGRMETTLVKADLAEVIRATATNFDGLATELSIDYRVDAAASVPAAIDVEKITRVVRNLLSNAFHFARHSVSVRLRVRDDDRHAFLEVADDGPGVPLEMRERVFERFRQGEGGATRRFGGTGLGLAIAKDFVELHGGRITIGDEPKGGAVFVVELPLDPPPSARVFSAAAQPPLPPWGPADELEAGAGPLRAAAPSTGNAPPDAPLVLVVEDNRDMVKFLEGALGEYRIVTANDGQEGLEKACALRPDLIVTDIMMPGLRGDALLRELRRRPETSTVPVVVLTAVEDTALRVRMLSDGAQDYVAKPFSADELLARVRNLIAVKKAREILKAELQTTQEDLAQLALEVTHKKRELEDALRGMRVARDVAERASRTKTMFLGLVSHELGTPLQAIRLNMDALRRRRETMPPLQAERLERVERASHRLTEMIESLLEFLRLDSGQLDVHSDEVSLAAATRLVVDDLDGTAREKGLELTLSVEGPVPPLRTDGRLVRLILVNLIGNAIKYTDRGRIDVTVTESEREQCVDVTDTGHGIPPEKVSQIFEPFTQLEELRHKHTRGVGLGLTLVREMVKALGGRVRVSSQVGRGSTFSLLLPKR